MLIDFASAEDPPTYQIANAMQSTPAVTLQLANIISV